MFDEESKNPENSQGRLSTQASVPVQVDDPHSPSSRVCDIFAGVNRASHQEREPIQNDEETLVMKRGDVRVKKKKSLNPRRSSMSVVFKLIDNLEDTETPGRKWFPNQGSTESVLCSRTKITSSRKICDVLTATMRKTTIHESDKLLFSSTLQQSSMRFVT